MINLRDTHCTPLEIPNDSHQ